MTIEKPPVLSKNKRKPYLAIEKCQVTDNFAGVYDAKFEIWNIDRLLEAQRDADAAYYEPIIEQIIKDDATRCAGYLDMAKAGVAREIFDYAVEICSEHSEKNKGMTVLRRQCSTCWQSLKSKYPKEETKE